MTEDNVNINMSSPKNRNARHISKPVELSGPIQSSIHTATVHSPKKEKGNIRVKDTLKASDHFNDVGHNNSLSVNIENSNLQTSSNIDIKEVSHPKELGSVISSSGCLENAQSNTSGISHTTKLTMQRSQYSPESRKEHTAKSPSKEKKENIDQLNCQLQSEHKNVVGNNCEVQMTTEMYETSESLPLTTSTDSSADNALNKRKERRKIVKKLAKDEKRKQRELEYKKNLQPKGQRVQVIDHNTFHKILKDGSLYNENKRPILSSEEFPALNILKHNRFPVTSCPHYSLKSDTEKVNATNNVKDSTKITETHSVVNGGIVNKTEKMHSVPSKLSSKGSVKKIGKLPKKRDPIQIDILQCIKMVKSKDAVVEPRKKLTTLERRNDRSLISGNELDSSNPQRSRGKKRENPKKKRPTRLKLVILHERELRKQLQNLQESELSQTKKACFGTETSVNSLTAVGIKIEQVEPVTNISENEIVETVPASTNFLTAGDKKLEQGDCVTNVSENVVETVPGSTNLLTTGAIKLEQVEPVANMSENVVKTMPGSLNLLTAGGIKLEQVETITNVLDTEVVEAVPGVENVPKEGRDKCEMTSSESKNAMAIMNQCFNAEDGSQIYLQRNQHLTNNQPYTNDRERVPDFMPSLFCSLSEILKKEDLEFNSSVSKSCCSVNLKQDQCSVAAAHDDIKATYIPSNAVKNEVLNSSQIEYCIGGVETISLTDQDACNNVQQMDCKKFLRDNVHDSSSDRKESVQKTVLHSRKFRPYCDHFLTPEINNSVSTLLKDVVKFHDRQFERDPVKANARRRHVTGLREVLKYLNLKRLKLIIIAPDMELVQGKGGICDIVEQLKEGAQNQEIPYVFALHRRALGKITFKKVPVSCIGIINYDGTEKNFHSLVAALHVARAEYQEALSNGTHSEEVDINKQVIEAALSRLKESSSTSCPEQSHFCSEVVQKWEE